MMAVRNREMVRKTYVRDLWKCGSHQRQYKLWLTSWGWTTWTVSGFFFCLCDLLSVDDGLYRKTNYILSILSLHWSIPISFVVLSRIFFLFLDSRGDGLGVTLKSDQGLFLILYSDGVIPGKPFRNHLRETINNIREQTCSAAGKVPYLCTTSLALTRFSIVF